MRRILRGDHEERHGQGACGALDGHLPLLHRFQQRALRLGCGAVYLVGKDHLREDRAGMEFEHAAGLIAACTLIYRHAEDVGRQQVAGELDALELQAQRAREHQRQRGLADSGHVFDEQVAVRQQTSERQPDLLRLAENDLLGLADDVVQVLAHGVFRSFMMLKVNPFQYLNPSQPPLVRGGAAPFSP